MTVNSIPTSFLRWLDNRWRWVLLGGWLALVAAVLSAGGVAASSPGFSEGAGGVLGSGRPAQAFTGREFIRNGAFDAGIPSLETSADDWGGGGSTGYFTVRSGGPTGNYLDIYAFGGGNPNYAAFQQIFLPTRTTGATLAFDYRLTTVNPSTVGAFVAQLVKIGASVDVLAEWVVANNVVGDTGWQSFQQALTSEQINALQTARDNGEGVFLILKVLATLEYNAYVDNVSFKLDGEWSLPQLDGRLAFSTVNQGRAAIAVADPTGANISTAWTSPNATGAFFGLDWKPNASEIAFASTHEFGFSPYGADIFALNTADGSVRRLTNPPGHSEIQSGSYGKGTVTGQVRNDSQGSSITQMWVYVQGAENFVSVSPPSYGNTVSFTASNVADLGSTGQYMVLIWSGQIDTNQDGIADKDCAGGIINTFAPVDVQAGQTVNAGTLSFNPATCSKYQAAYPDWRPDGSQVGFMLDAVPSRVDMSGNRTDPFAASGVLVYQFAWDPADATKLAYAVSAGTGQGLYQVTEGGSTGTLLTNAVSPWELAWLPDGSGIVFTDGSDLYRYAFSDGQTVQLTALNLRDSKIQGVVGNAIRDLAVSPDGKYVVFSRRGPGSLTAFSLWMLNLQNVNEMWQVVPASYNAKYVDWGNPPANGGGGGGGGGNHRIYLPFVRR